MIFSIDGFSSHADPSGESMYPPHEQKYALAPMPSRSAPRFAESCDKVARSGEQGLHESVHVAGDQPAL